MERRIMKMLCVAMASVTLLGLTAFAQADDPKNEATIAKLLGKWEITKTREENLVGAIVTFEKGGKANVVMKVDGKETKLEGTYKVEKDKLISELNGNTDTNTITKLTDTALELENSDASVTTILKKKK
jgi:uncharacterized protein (TIGR03066 family)